MPEVRLLVVAHSTVQACHYIDTKQREDLSFPSLGEILILTSSEDMFYFEWIDKAEIHYLAGYQRAFVDVRKIHEMAELKGCEQRYVDISWRTVK